MVRKRKALLAEQGIVHLKHSFVQPTEESGLLKTVGGAVDRSALILSTGSYGYAIPVSTLTRDDQREDEDDDNDSLPEVMEVMESTSDPDIKIVRQVLPGNDGDGAGSSSTSSSKSSSRSSRSKSKSRDKSERKSERHHRKSDKKSSERHSRKKSENKEKKDINPDDLSIAELVREIGGGSGAPLRLCDVVDDRKKADSNSKDGNEEEDTGTNENEDVGELGDDPEADAFYESLGIQRCKKRKLDNDEAEDASAAASLKVAVDNANANENNLPNVDVIQVVEEDCDMLQSVTDYYKDNANKLYYYSQQHNPYDQHRLEFGPYIDGDDSLEHDQDYIQLARLAQRARAAAQAAMERRKRETQPDPQANAEVIYDPLPMEVVSATKPEDLGITVDTNFEQYWEFVKEDPHDFDRWIYLIQYVESTNNLNNCRTVYSAFLPLFPYCFGYWKRYSELEKKSYYHGRALAILDKGLEFIPLSVDLWLSYIALFKEINAHQPDFEIMVRREFQRALNTCGMEFRSDLLWETFIEWETGIKRLKRAFILYRRLIQVPTRLYNRHWDDVQEMIRDHHPRDFLEYDEYEAMRKKGCKKFGFRYKPEPEVEPGELRKTSKPEDKLMDYTKSKILKKLTSMHTKCEEEVNKRWLFEDKIKRPYYHTKPLDKFQLRNWDAYTNFEIQEKNYDRTVLLFERCLIACANYEEFWAKYARYVENYHKEHSVDMNVSIHVQKAKINEEIVSQKETEKEEAIVADVKETLESIVEKIVATEEEEENVKAVMDSIIEKVLFLEENDNFVFNKFSTIAVNELSQQLSRQKVGSADGTADSESRWPDLCDNKLSHKSGDIDNNLSSNSAEVTSLISIPTFPQAYYRWQETVRDIYRRACIIHCPKKPIIRLQWAAYEEELGNLDESRKLIQHVLQWFPNFMDAKLQLVDLERRAGNYKVLEELYNKYLTTTKVNSEYSLLANKFSRFLFKERGKADKALTVLRKAIRKDKANASLYSRVFDICYERYPSDPKGAAASLELAILSKDLTEKDKLIFLRRKMLFFQEHGDIRRVRDAVDQLRIAEQKMQVIKAEQQRIKEEEEKEVAFLRSAAYKKLEDIDNLQAYPVPEISKTNETTDHNPVPIEFESNMDGDYNNESHTNYANGPIRAQIVTQGGSVNEAVTDGPELPYQKVPPPNEFIVDTSTYGYGSKHPDQKIMEHMAQKEYEKLESVGYPENVKDTEEDKKYLRLQTKLKHSMKDQKYIVAPRESYSVVPVGPPPRRRMNDPPAPGELELKPPRAMAILPIPSTAPCVNVPEWFVKDGGELCLSESNIGFSILRYWPHFLTEEGNEKMFRNVRRHVKWHQKQKIIAGHWRYLHRLVSWLGPCDFTHNGMVMQKCEDWPPEILDQLHRLNQMTNHEFNACSMDLYRHGHDWNSWHSDNLPAYGSNPPVAIVTLGSLRILELKRKGPEFNYIRLPLFPGSLLLMEGVMQLDWAHQITKDPMIKDETLTLTFRIMHAIEMPDPDKLMKFVKGGDRAKEKDVNGKPAKEVEIDPLFKAFIRGSDQGSKQSDSSPAAAATTVVENESDKPADPVDEKGRKSTKIIFHKIR